MQDILKILERRSPFAQVVVFPAHVQGKQAEKEICTALEKADTQGCDVLILGRGGGSAEELNLFNAESIVRAVHACQTPVISAVGHETDFTLTDYAADIRASTPSAAAELVSPEQYPKILSENQQKIISVHQVTEGEQLKIYLPDGYFLVRAEKKELINDE